MNTENTIKRRLRLLRVTGCFLLFFTLSANAQTDLVVQRKNNSTIVDIDTLTGIKNKTIRFEMDTVYTINHYGVKAFHKCIADLQRVKNLSGSLDTLSLNINGIQRDVNRMYYNINDVSNFIKKYNTETDKKLTQLTIDNKTLNDNLIKANEELIKVQANLKAQKLKNLGTKLMWGAGGITVGGLVMGLLIIK